MVEKGRKIEYEKIKREMHTTSSKDYMRDFLALRNAIIENCRDCIRDCGRDCLDVDARPLENIKCPLQRVRIDYGIAIRNKGHDFPGVRDPKNHDNTLF